MTRLPYPKKHELNSKATAIYNEILKSRGEVDAPFKALLHSPEILRRTAMLGTYLRFESSLPNWARELVIVTTAHEQHCAYEWRDHQPKALDAGVRQETLDILQNGTAPSGLTDVETILVEVVIELIRFKKLNAKTFNLTIDEFGIGGLADIVVLAGYYSFLAGVINTFELAP